MRATTDFAVVGAGIVGLTTARAIGLARPGSRIVVIDKESRVGEHQTGRNSGVLHSGIYYRPGSLKAAMCKAGGERMVRFAEERGVAHEICGKLIVATQEAEVPRLHSLYRRGLAHELPVRWIERSGIKDFEPHAHALAALHVASTGIIDYSEVCRVLANDIRSAGGELILDARVESVSAVRGITRVTTSAGDVQCKVLVNCAGLYSDVVARMARTSPQVRILPFRGEYFHLTASSEHLVKNLIYPVPNPDLPFLGVHLTRSINGGVHAGPNAVFALAREGYRWRDVNLREMWWAASYPGSWRLARRWWQTGLDEIVRSMSRSRFLASLRTLVPEIGPDDLLPAPSGVRAQAVSGDGLLVDDFSIAVDGRVVSVLNAPSPAATSALAIGDYVASRAISARD